MGGDDEMLYFEIGDPNGTIRHADGRPYKPFGDSYIENGKIHWDPKVQIVPAEALMVPVDYPGDWPGFYDTGLLDGVLVRPLGSIYARAMEQRDRERRA